MYMYLNRFLTERFDLYKTKYSNKHSYKSFEGILIIFFQSWSMQTTDIPTLLKTSTMRWIRWKKKKNLALKIVWNCAKPLANIVITNEFNIIYLISLIAFF